jgi:hypothetical protein
VSKSKQIDPVGLVNELKFLLLTKAMIAKIKVLLCVNVESDLNCPRVFGRIEKIGVDQLKFLFRAFSKNVVLPGIKENIAVLLCDGKELELVSMLFSPLPQSISGLIKFY